MAVIGLIGSVATAQLAVGAIDTGSADDQASTSETTSTPETTSTSVDGLASEPVDATGLSTGAPETGTSDTGDNKAGEVVAGSTEEESRKNEEDGLSSPVDCPPLFEVLFSLGSSNPMIDPGSGPEDMASWMTAHPAAKLLIDGHADAGGSEQVNLQLSFRRAEATAALLIEAGVMSDRLQTRGFGEYQPIVGAPSDSERNRRVTMQVPGRDDCPPDDKEGTE